jgi:TolB-like protein
MRWMVAIAWVALLGLSPAFAAPASPSTRPAAPQADRDMRPRVLVMPFEELADAPARAWVGKAMQQSLVAELTRSGLVSVLTPADDAAPATDAAAAAKAARDVQAPLVIIGSYQLVGDELRVTGQMLESINGEPIAGIKATGTLRDLFGIQDMIGNQVRRDLQVILQPTPVAGTDPGTNTPSQRPSTDPFRIEPSGPVRQQVPTGAYMGSDLQRSLNDQWAPLPDPNVQNGRNRNRYGYPTAPYYPSYGYYDWCGYSWPIIVRPGFSVVPPGPGPTRTDFPQNNYVTQPGQMGRPSGNNNYVTTPGQMGRPSGNNNYVTTPGQMGRPSGNTNFNNPPGQMGRPSGGNQIGSSGNAGGRGSGSSSSGGSGSRSIPGSSGNASGRDVGSTSGDASRR